jgi:hypothetical protein
MYRSSFFLTSALVGAEWSASRRGRFNPRRRSPGTQCVEVWVGRSGRRGEEKYFDHSVTRTPTPRSSCPVASCYTDYAIGTVFKTLDAKSTWTRLIAREVSNAHYRRESFRSRKVQAYVTEATSVQDLKSGINRAVEGIQPQMCHLFQRFRKSDGYCAEYKMALGQNLLKGKIFQNYSFMR